MRTSSLARLVVASLGASVVITLGCAEAPAAPSPTPGPRTTFSVHSILPAEGLIAGATVATIAGTGFQSGDTVTVDGNRVDATVLSAYTISITMPAHAAANVDVTVISAISKAQAGVPGGYAYVVTTGPVISELLPNIGSTDGAPVIIRGTGFKPGLTVSVDGIVSTDCPYPHNFSVNSTSIHLCMQAHAAGTMQVIVTNPDGQAASAEFTYAASATFDFNGDWQGWTDGACCFIELPFVMTIRDNVVVSVSCGGSSLTLDPPPIVTNGTFSFTGSGGVWVSGKILSPIYATGWINTTSCPKTAPAGSEWFADRKQ
jgi:nitrogen regulatory protein PII